MSMEENSGFAKILAAHADIERILRVAYRMGHEDALVGIDALDDETTVRTYAAVTDMDAVTGSESDALGFLDACGRSGCVCLQMAPPKVISLYRTEDERDAAVLALREGGFVATEAYGLPVFVHESDLRDFRRGVA